MGIVIHDLTLWQKAVGVRCSLLMIDMIVHAATPQIYKSQDFSLFLTTKNKSPDPARGFFCV